MKRGRQISIPIEMQSSIFTMHKEGMGVRKLSNYLWSIGIQASRSSVYRLLAGLPPYGVICQQCGNVLVYDSTDFGVWHCQHGHYYYK